MMGIPNRSQPPTAMSCISGTLLSLVLLATPAAVFAHGGHGEDFQGGTEVTQAAGAIQVDAEIAKRLGIKVEPVTPQRLAVGIETIGQIETLPNQKVEITTPVPGTLVKLLVEPGDLVKPGQPLAILSSPELAELRVDSMQNRAEAEADVQEAQADLHLAQQNYDRQRQITAAEIEQARTELQVAQEQYDRDRDLVSAGALPRRQMLESQAHLAEAKAEVAKATSRQEFLSAQAQLKRAQAAVEVAQSRVKLSNAAYQARLEQLGAYANSDGTVAIKAPISGKVAAREATPGESFEEAGEPLMTIVNDNSVFATANIYEKDLGKVEVGQPAQVKVASLPNQTFTGQVTFIGSAVEGETRVVPVKARLANSSGLLKPGMFAQWEILTDKTPTAILAIPTTAVVEANGKQIVYVQNGNAYQPVEMSLGQTSGNMVEVKSGLFEGDRVVTQGAMQLYAQSLRGGSNTKGNEGHGEATAPSQTTNSNRSGSGLPWWAIPTGGAIAAAAFWTGRRTQRRLTPAYQEAVETLPVTDLPNGSKATGVCDQQVMHEAPLGFENNSHQHHQHTLKTEAGKFRPHHPKS